MSYVFNMVGGGGGVKDTNAILTVSVPTGSTVTAAKGGITFTPTMWVEASDNTLDFALFVIKPSLFDAQNAWTVTATLGTDSVSDTVLIDSNERYDLQLDYGYYLYKLGDEYSSRTGGWGITGYSASNSTLVQATKHTNDITFTGSNGVITFIGTLDLVSLPSDYTTFKVNVTSLIKGAYWPQIMIKTSKTNVNTSTDAAGKDITETGVISLDISSLGNTAKYVCFYLYSNGTMAFDKVWLE